MDIIDHVAAALGPESVEKVVMYKIDRRGEGPVGSKNRSLGRTQSFSIYDSYPTFKDVNIVSYVLVLTKTL